MNTFMAMSNRNGFATHNAKNLVGIEPLGETTYWLSPHGSLHFANTFVVEKLDQPTMTVVLNLPKAVKQIRNERGNASLLSSYC